MAGKYTYLLINLCTVIFPLALSFDKRVQFYKGWKHLWPAIFITGVFFAAWDMLFVQQGVWTFNKAYIAGIYLFNLPLEEVLFFITVPYACIFIYACLNYYIKWQLPALIGKTISILILAVSGYLVVSNYHRLYTLVVFGLLFLVLLFSLMVWGTVWLSRFYCTYLMVLVPFFMVNGLLTAIPVVIYHVQEILQIRAGTIPVEDFFYLMALLLMNLSFFEYFNQRSKQAQ